MPHRNIQICFRVFSQREMDILSGLGICRARSRFCRVDFCMKINRLVDYSDSFAIFAENKPGG